MGKERDSKWGLCGPRSRGSGIREVVVLLDKRLTGYGPMIDEEMRDAHGLG